MRFRQVPPCPQSQKLGAQFGALVFLHLTINIFYLPFSWIHNKVKIPTQSEQNVRHRGDPKLLLMVGSPRGSPYIHPLVQAGRSNGSGPRNWRRWRRSTALTQECLEKRRATRARMGDHLLTGQESCPHFPTHILTDSCIERLRGQIRMLPQKTNFKVFGTTLKNLSS